MEFPPEIVEWINEKCWNTAKNSKYASKNLANICPAVGNIEAITLRSQVPLCFVPILSLFTVNKKLCCV